MPQNHICQTNRGGGGAIANSYESPAPNAGLVSPIVPGAPTQAIAPGATNSLGAQTPRIETSIGNSFGLGGNKAGGGASAPAAQASQTSASPAADNNARHVALGGAMVGALAGTNVSSNYGQNSSIPTPGSGPSGTIAAPAGFGGMTDPSQKVRGTVTDVPQNISSGQAQIDGTTATPPPIRGAAELGGKVMDAAKSLTENAAKSYMPNQSRGGGGQ